jgi:hypothetical protein
MRLILLSGLLLLITVVPAATLAGGGGPVWNPAGNSLAPPYNTGVGNTVGDNQSALGVLAATSTNNVTSGLASGSAVLGLAWPWWVVIVLVIIWFIWYLASRKTEASKSLPKKTA